MAGLFSSLNVGDAQYAVSVTDKTQAETMQLCTPTCSTNGTHSDGYTGAFEGPEKLLEMWFASTDSAAMICADSGAELCGDDDQDQWSELRSGLRLVPRAVWRDMLELVHCQVLSTLCNERLDSYLLRQVSESSFFVYPHKLVLKTCGTTTLLYAIPRILEIARRYLGVTGVYQVFYSRKNFMFPDQQEELHRSWEKEVAYLDAHFPEGSAYMIGKTNRDHWHVYLCGPYQEATTPLLCALDDDSTANNSVEVSPQVCALSRSSSRSTVHSLIEAARVGTPSSPPPSDTTVEILMTGLDPHRMRAMYLGGASVLEGSLGGKAVERATGIADIYPDSASDSYLFTPCGFSLNGLQGDGYYTIHVTPEPHCSYASFETTVSCDSALDLNSSAGVKKLVEQVTAVFGPRSVTVTVFKARGDTAPANPSGLPCTGGADDGGKAKAALLADVDTAPPVFASVAGYKSVDRVLYEFDHYWLRYAYYAKAD
ncbi:spermidine resistance protein [Coemansia aciculifera]|uniref:Spermidine resistance protein n=1 Tax=Coemansia aciculifera TaxID=417176 RepID=A0ACC1MAR7_9FUNG|nr:spermidine resistance protein [Coemansia aciculifera]